MDASNSKTAPPPHQEYCLYVYTIRKIIGTGKMIFRGGAYDHSRGVHKDFPKGVTYGIFSVHIHFLAA